MNIEKKRKHNVLTHAHVKLVEKVYNCSVTSTFFFVPTILSKYFLLVANFFGNIYDSII